MSATASSAAREDTPVAQGAPPGYPPPYPPGAPPPPPPGYPYFYGYPPAPPHEPAITYQQLVQAVNAAIAPLAADLKGLQIAAGDTVRRADLDALRAEFRTSLERLEGGTYPRAQLDTWRKAEEEERKELRQGLRDLQKQVLGAGWSMFLKVVAGAGGVLTLLELSRYLRLP